MTLGWLPRAAILLVAPLLSVMAAAQGGAPPAGQLNIPDNVAFVGKQDPSIRKATAIVNGEVITGSDIDHRLALVLASNRIELPPEELGRYRAQILRNLIDETLQIQAAAQEEISVEPREVDQYYERFAQSFQQTPANFSAYLRSIGSSERSMKRQIRGELSWQRLQRRWIEPFVTVGEDEVNAMIARMTASRGTAEYRVAEIYLSATPETAAEVQANALRISEQIRAGANFQAVARQFSEATTAAVGGDLGWIRAEQLPDELAAVVRQMPVGAVSQPIPLPGGYSIVFLIDNRQILVADPRDALLSLIQIAIVSPPGTTEAQGQAIVQRLGAGTRSMGGCGRAREVAQTLGAEVVENDQVRVRDLPPLLQQMLLDLSVGQATPPFGSIERISVLVLCGRDDPEVAADPTFEQVYNRITEERVGRRAMHYLRDLRRDAVVDYR